MTATPLDLLRSVLSMRDPTDELSAWLAPTTDGMGGTVPFFMVAAKAVSTRHFDLLAIADGFNKTGLAVLAFVDAVKARAPGPPEPETYEVSDHRLVLYVWRTPTGPKVVAFQRAKATGVGYAPDYWRQVKATSMTGGAFLIDLVGDSITWDVPKRQAQREAVRYTVEERAETPCTIPDCPAKFLIDCNHKSFEEELGDRLPDHAPVVGHGANQAPAVAAGRVKCDPCTALENGAIETFHVPPPCDQLRPCRACGHHVYQTRDGLVCRSPGCPGEIEAAPLVDAVTTREAARDLQARHSMGGDAGGGMTEGDWQDHLDPHSELNRGDEDQDPSGPVFYDSTGPEPNNGWTNTPVGADDPRVGERVDEPPEEAIVHCPGAWVPPGTNLLACHPIPSDSKLTLKLGGNTEQGLRARLPEITCVTCRKVMEAVMEAGRWAGPDLTAKGRGWIEDGVPACSHKHVCESAHPGAPCEDTCPCPAECNCHPCPGGSAIDAAIASRTSAPAPEEGCAEPTGCACGHDKDAHATPPGSTACAACACVRYRPGAKAPSMETPKEQSDYLARRRRAWVLSLDMGNVRNQKTSKKAYPCCELCNGMIRGPEKNEKGRVTRKGDEWVSPKDKVSRRAHLSCADEALSEVNAEATA